GKIGALVLATQACLRSGGGLVTTYMPRCGYEIMQTAAPEAMAMVDKQIDYLNAVPPQMERFDSLGVGPGMGTDKATGDFLLSMISNCKKPVVLDADALNLLALNQKFLSQLFLNTILTPHPKEFERLFGPTASEFDRIILAREKAIALQIIIILKGHHTLIALPNGKAFFNSTGNAGMAKGGSGDVLTGIIASLLAQGYEPPHAAILGVYVHGRAGDVAAKALSQEAMTARDIIKNLSTVFLALHKMAPEA
ncbi:MAG TPA: NAD(P)H-hydrate dehydratase, partial [Niastella sp.]|nr:NAD(P)H-hydrate dehydratase [Niastella sp.]